MTTAPEFKLGAGAAPAHDDAYYFLFSGFRMLLWQNRDALRIPRAAGVADLGLPLSGLNFIGRYGDVPCFAAEIDGDVQQQQLYSLRGLYGAVDDALFWAAARAVQIIDWGRTHQFCGRCGTRTTGGTHEHVKQCPNCGLSNYPRLAPAVIVRVTRGDRILLAHNRRYTGDMYSVLAGFVEPGESFEQTVRREIREEVGIEVANIRYFGSQPWPFPHSLMVAFTAAYAGGDFVYGDDEIEHADWYSAGELPTYPSPPSIANRLIVDFIEQQQS